MAEHPTVDGILDSIQAEGHDPQICNLVRKAAKSIESDRGKMLGKQLIVLFQERYAQHQTNNN